MPGILKCYGALHLEMIEFVANFPVPDLHRNMQVQRTGIFIDRKFPGN